jgi:hypothetical protein
MKSSKPTDFFLVTGAGYIGYGNGVGSSNCYVADYLKEALAR